MIKFTYTKTNGEVSERSLIVTEKPFPDYLGLDVSSVDPVALSVIEKEMQLALDNYNNHLDAIAFHYDLVHNLRRFKPERMTNISVV
jgi:hypothetical protein